MNGDGSLPAANEPVGGSVGGREQRISDSGHSSAGSVASAGSSNANNESGKLPNGRGEFNLKELGDSTLFQALSLVSYL